MEIFDIGTPELLLIVILAIALLGPKRMEEAGRTVGRFLNKVVQSDAWRAIKEISSAIVTAPNRMMREANFEDMQKELGLDSDGDLLSMQAPPNPSPYRGARKAGEPVDDNSIQPPSRSQAYTSALPPAPAPKKKTSARKAASPKSKASRKRAGTAKTPKPKSKSTSSKPKSKKRSDA